jgi:pimeloyl-ACP methyl ester carboxylesterase
VLQADLATLVPDARLVVLADSEHLIHLDQPQTVVDAIQTVADAVRDPTTWPSPATPAP